MGDNNGSTFGACADDVLVKTATGLLSSNTVHTCTMLIGYFGRLVGTPSTKKIWYLSRPEGLPGCPSKRL